MQPLALVMPRSVLEACRATDLACYAMRAVNENIALRKQMSGFSPHTIATKLFTLPQCHMYTATVHVGRLLRCMQVGWDTAMHLGRVGQHLRGLLLNRKFLIASSYATASPSLPGHGTV